MLLLVSLAQASTDDIGGDALEDVEAGVTKLVSLEATEAAVVTKLEFAVSGSADQTVILVLYVRDDRGYRLLARVDAEEVEDGYAATGAVRWLFEPGEVYALGAYVSTGYTCFYDEDAGDSPWFAEVVEGYQVAEIAPATFRGDEGEPTFYQMRVTSEDADFDGDGAISTHWGGTDCDDTDPDIIDEIEDEIPYDGIDQDCDGSDLDDVDGDGHAGAEVGGLDCDDTTGEISPSRLDVCEDGVDNDCAGGDAICVDDDEDEEEEEIDEGVGAATGCDCSTAPSAPGVLGILTLAALRRRRAR